MQRRVMKQQHVLSHPSQHGSTDDDRQWCRHTRPKSPWPAQQYLQFQTSQSLPIRGSCCCKQRVWTATWHSHPKLAIVHQCVPCLPVSSDVCVRLQAYAPRKVTACSSGQLQAKLVCLQHKWWINAVCMPTEQGACKFLPQTLQTMRRLGLLPTSASLARPCESSSTFLDFTS